MSSFHIWGLEIEGNGGDTSAERPRIEVASDASLDEGAIIRTTADMGSPWGGPVQYFLGLDGAEAECVRLALVALRTSDRETFNDNWGEMVEARVERLLGYLNATPEEGGPPYPATDRDLTLGSPTPAFPAPLYPVGTRVRLTEDVERYPHFIVPKGATGTVNISEADLFSVKMDEPIRDPQRQIVTDWDNEVHWYMQGEAGDADDPRGYLEKLEPRTLTATFDVTGLTDQQVEGVAIAVAVQAEANDDLEEERCYPDVPVEIDIDPPLPVEPRTILVHLNIELPPDAPATTDDVVREIEGALEVGIDENPPDGATGNTPALLAAKITVPLAEEI